MAHPFLHAPVRGRIRWPQERTPKRWLAACLLAVGYVTAFVSDAAAISESELRALETQALGAEHAAEHATERAAARRASRVTEGTGPSVTAKAAQVDPADGGRWSSPFPAKTFG